MIQVKKISEDKYEIWKTRTQRNFNGQEIDIDVLVATVSEADVEKKLTQINNEKQKYLEIKQLILALR